MSGFIDDERADTTDQTLPAGVFRRFARLETVILVIAWIGTFAAKVWAVRPQFSEDKPIELLQAAAADATFIALTALVLALLAWQRPTPFAARMGLVVSCVVAFWALLNAWWLVSTGSQIQPSVLVAASREAPTCSAVAGLLCLITRKFKSSVQVYSLAASTHISGYNAASRNLTKNCGSFRIDLRVLQC
jgi:hypothetical protein